MALSRYSGFGQALLALAVVLSVAVAPVAATPGDGGVVGGDDSGDGGGIVANTTDQVGDTVSSTTGTDATNETTDTVESTTGTDVTNETTDAVESATSTADEPVDAAGSTAETVSDTVSTVTDGAAPTAGATPTDPGGSSTAADPAAGDPLERRVGTGDLPVGVGVLPVDQLPGTGDDAPVQPEDSPYGSNGQGRMDACALPVRQDDLPVEQVPGPGDLPVDPNVPGVPVGLLTPRTIAEIAYAVPPRPCTIYDPHDPSLDPTDPPTNPGAVVETDQVDAGADGLKTNGGSRSRLEKNGIEGIALWGVIANPEQVGGGQRLRATDGRTARYLYLESLGLLMVERRTARGDVAIGVFGKSFAAGTSCDLSDPASAAPSAENPTGPCEYGYTGLPSAVGPGTIIDILQNPPTESPV